MEVKELLLASFCDDEPRSDEKLEVIWVGDVVFLPRLDSAVESRVVERGVSPRRSEEPGAGWPQAEGCPLTSRAPELELWLVLLAFCVAVGWELKFM